jgi:hypothetical protein
MIILNAKEIKDLAEFAGFTISSQFAASDEELEDEEFVVTDCPKEGTVDDDGTARHYDHIAYLSDYPEEGVCPLGNERTPA